MNKWIDCPYQSLYLILQEILSDSIVHFEKKLLINFLGEKKGIMKIIYFANVT